MQRPYPSQTIVINAIFLMAKNDQSWPNLASFDCLLSCLSAVY
ncbi:hypothetical protein TRICHSKD4_3833 [Roseibium sp. TrichSKD4]|nr:hypothetical protein TRICHSKD4_3833 [Roseibium sp. TrichSKD4]